MSLLDYVGWYLLISICTGFLLEVTGMYENDYNEVRMVVTAGFLWPLYLPLIFILGIRDLYRYHTRS